MSKALLIVDVQNDFCEGGSLAVDGGNQVARDISAYLDKHGSEYDLVIATRDWHEPDSDNGGHISPEPDFIDTWPPHCIVGTDGAAYHSELWPTGDRYPHGDVLKGHGFPAYSGFEGVDDTGTSLLGLLKQAQIEDVDVVGLAFDYCVKATAMDAKTSGFNVRVLEDLSAAIHNDGKANRALEAAGVVVTDSHQK